MGSRGQLGLYSEYFPEEETGMGEKQNKMGAEQNTVTVTETNQLIPRSKGTLKVIPLKHTSAVCVAEGAV